MAPLTKSLCLLGIHGNIYFKSHRNVKLVTESIRGNYAKGISFVSRISMVLRRGIPTTYPHMIVRLAKPSATRVFPGGMADCCWTCLTARSRRDTLWKTVCLLLQSSRSAVYRVVQQESHDRSVAIDLYSSGRTKFMGLSSMAPPKTRSRLLYMDETLRNDSVTWTKLVTTLVTWAVL
ncbi:hypothetical protein AVEN_135833-1 [Araneus ventricosus]|uniref:Uncharacterized protein n=1 Tax=Araneus ventricosus TaxID=182803 RepID=A0A4Y2BZ71_ARAVE|nr:hypothetical protein AVEN_135833-1 [Araneus ventricosus]